MSDNIWGPIDISTWKCLPVVSGRCAAESDVEAGKAVFYIPVGQQYEPSHPHQIVLPRPAMLIDNGQPVFVIQSEIIDGKNTMGYRTIEGGNGICMAEELELIEEPDDRFVYS